MSKGYLLCGPAVKGRVRTIRAESLPLMAQELNRVGVGAGLNVSDWEEVETRSDVLQSTIRLQAAHVWGCEPLKITLIDLDSLTPEETEVLELSDKLAALDEAQLARRDAIRAAYKAGTSGTILAALTGLSRARISQVNKWA